MAYLGWWDGELRPDGWFDAELQAAGWFDTELVDTSAPSGPVTHATSGALTGQASAIAASASRFRSMSSSAVLLGQLGSVVGAASRSGGPVTHATTGALTGQIGSVAGAAARRRAMAASGALSGSGASVAGAGSRTRAHPATGALAGQLGSLAGSASRSGAAVIHATTGVLAGATSLLEGSAALGGSVGGGYDDDEPKKRKRYLVEVDGNVVPFDTPAEASAFFNSLSKNKQKKAAIKTSTTTVLDVIQSAPKSIALSSVVDEIELDDEEVLMLL